MKKLNFALPFIIAALFAAPAHAMTDEEYVQAVGKEFRQASMTSLAYGKATAYVLVDNGVVTIDQSSGNVEFDAEVLRAATAAYNPSVQGKLRFPVWYTVSPEQWKETERLLDMRKMMRP